MGVEGLENLTLELGNLFSTVLPHHHGLVTKKIAFEAFNGMVMKTPVKTGRARANWGVKIGSPASAHEGVDNQPIGSAPGPQLAGASETINGAPDGKTIYVTNALPYIEALESGHSTQGAHMVELTVMEIKSHYGI